MKKEVNDDLFGIQSRVYLFCLYSNTVVTVYTSVIIKYIVSISIYQAKFSEVNCRGAICVLTKIK